MSRFGSEGEDIIGRWSEEKLDLLAKYLKAYSVIMNEQKKSWLGAFLLTSQSWVSLVFSQEIRTQNQK